MNTLKENSRGVRRSRELFPEISSSVIGWLLVLLGLGLAVRLGLWFVSEPKAVPDTGTYFELAEQIARWEFSNYEARRTPGYSLLLLMVGSSPEMVWLVQMLIGLAIAGCLYYIALALTGSPAFACFCGLTYHLNLGQLFFEPQLIPETQTTFFVAATVACLALINRRLEYNKPIAAMSLIAGLCAGAAVMARPQFVFLPPLLTIAIACASMSFGGLKWRIAAVHAALALAPGVMMILAWASFNSFQIGRFTLSSHTGIGLMEHTIAYAELAPARYEPLKEVLVKHRDRHLALTGRHTATWNAISELKAVTGLPLAALDGELVKMSAALIVEQPSRYLALVADAWVSFWLVSSPKGIAEVKANVVAKLLFWMWRIEHPILRVINAMFLVLIGLAIFSSAFRARTNWGFLLSAISAIALCSSLLQAFVIGVENTRYGVTVQPLIVLAVSLVLYGWVKAPALFKAPITRRMNQEVTNDSN